MVAMRFLIARLVVVLRLVPLVLLLVVRVCLVHPARLVRLLEEWTKEGMNRISLLGNLIARLIH